ncbi:SCO1664 family protein [Pedococcus sp. 5OH_020]|uniref:SCO1664 family protein n=1 Tax=Pedococcus sp. 5OH_020 TaxID=2989814 RepID=UPI0022E9C1DB|nr:SCO1664 family protein [Pedococcus sp. 5OH_020]
MDLLAHADLVVLGALADASNLALLVRLGDEAGPLAIYKPVSGERPLWDFPDGSLAARERAAYLLSRAGGWDIVPETVLRDGPHGEGSVQRWVGNPDVAPEYVVDLVRPDAVPPGWVPVLRGENERGRPVIVVHQDSAAVRAVAAFDAMLNNSDRKGSHLVREGTALRGFDHGVSLHEDHKLRTVLWGFAGQRLSAVDLHRLTTVLEQLSEASSSLSRELRPLLTTAELVALRRRTRALVEEPVYPVPSGQWPAIPWPPL